MKLTILLFNLLAFFVGFSQVNADFVPSKGQIPKIIVDEMIPFFVLPTSDRQQMLVTNSKSDNILCRTTLLNSGFVSFGTDDVSLLNTAFKELSAKLYPGENFEVFIFRSTVPTSFHYGNSIFITTKLLSSLTSKEEALFFILREVEAMKMSDLGRSFRTTFTAFGLADYVKFAAYKSDSVEVLIDKLSFDKFSKEGFSNSDMINALTNASKAEMPFSDELIKPEYFKSTKLELPTNLFDLLIDKPQDKLLSILEYENKFKKRIQPYGELIEHTNEQKIEENFKELNSRAKIELIRLEIANSEHLSAIYKIYNLENDLSINLDYLKGLAWVGIVDQQFGGNQKRKSLPFYGSKHLSSGFYNYINVQNGYLKVIMALNTITKLIEENPNQKNLKTMRTQIIDVLNNSKYFDPKALADKKELNGEVNANDQVIIKNYDFYLGKIDQFVSASELLSLEEKSNRKPTVAIIDAGKQKTLIKSMNKLQFDSKRSAKLSNAIGEPPVDQKSIGQYNEFENYAYMMFQAYENSKYKNTFLPINFNYYQKDKTNLTYHDFTGDFRPKFKQIYFIGLTVIGMAYVIPNIALASQSTWNSMVTMDGETGNMLIIKHEYSRDFLTKMNIRGRQVQTLK